MKSKELLAVILLVLGASDVNASEPPPYSDMNGKRLSSIECLAVNLYHESRSESDFANIAINTVVFNRVNDKRFPDTICGVIFQKSQFSWTGNGLSDTIKDKAQYERLYRLSESTLLNRDFIIKYSEGINHYHTTTSHPYWSNSRGMVFINQVDNHNFYKWK